MRHLTPKKTIRTYCKDCCVGQIREIRLCPIIKCEIYPYRFGKMPKKEDLEMVELHGIPKYTPIRAMRKYCLECGGGSVKDVRFCDVKKCPLYVYRFGKRPLEVG